MSVVWLLCYTAARTSAAEEGEVCALDSGTGVAIGNSTFVVCYDNVHKTNEKHIHLGDVYVAFFLIVDFNMYVFYSKYQFNKKQPSR